MKSQTSKMLSMDDTIDKLSDEAIKDIWVRQAAFKRLRKVMRAKYGDRPTGAYGTDEFQNMKDGLTVGENSRNFYHVLQGMDMEYRKALRQEDQSPEDYLREKLTKDDMPEDEKIKSARHTLKAACEGCGTPHIELIRDSVKAWAETEEVTQQ